MLRKRFAVRVISSAMAAMLILAQPAAGTLAEEFFTDNGIVEYFVDEGVFIDAGFYEDEGYYEEYFDEDEYLEYEEYETDEETEEETEELRGKVDPEYGPDEFHERSKPETGYRFRKNPKENKFEDFELYTKEDAEEYFHLVSHDQLPVSVDLDVEEVLQRPELPTGCESISLTMALRYEGFDLLKTTIAAEFLLYNLVDENAAIGFIGDPFDDSGAGCFAPALAATANNFFIDQGYNYRGFDISGSEFEELLGYVAAGTPVMIWCTVFMEPVEYTGETGELNGTEYKWYNSEHCALLTGYDLKKGKLKINDPMEGIVYRDYDELKEIYDEVGQYAVVVKDLDSRSYAAESDNNAANTLGIMIEVETEKKH